MTITSDTEVGEVVKLNFNTAPLFHANNIDYCCGGSKTISEACNEAGIEPKQLIVLFNESAGELTMHMQKEEIMLFPYIQKMVRAKNYGSLISRSAFVPVANPIGMMISEHETEGRRFTQAYSPGK
jgi:iron-sulfur cluster repair protein YtfE (RIC family)